MSVDFDQAVHDALGEILDLAPLPPAEPPDLAEDQPERPARRLVVLAVAAALVALVVVGVVLLRSGSPARAPANSAPTTVEPSPSSTTMVTPTDAVVSDPMAISLARWVSGPARAAAGPFLVFDLADVPAGWAVAMPPSGYHDVTDLDETHYSWGVTLTAPDGRLAGLLASRGDRPRSGSAGRAVQVHGQPGTIQGDRVTWTDPTGVELTVTLEGATGDELVAAAEQFGLTTTAALGATLEVGGQPSAGTPILGGDLGSRRWTVVSRADASPTPLSLDVDGG